MIYWFSLLLFNLFTASTSGSSVFYLAGLTNDSAICNYLWVNVTKTIEWILARFIKNDIIANSVADTPVLNSLHSYISGYWSDIYEFGFNALQCVCCVIGFVFAVGLVITIVKLFKKLLTFGVSD